jgi:hypothetical protein
LTTLRLKRWIGLNSVKCSVYICEGLFNHLIVPFTKKEELTNLSSFHIDQETMPEHWPPITPLPIQTEDAMQDSLHRKFLKYASNVNFMLSF